MTNIEPAARERERRGKRCHIKKNAMLVVFLSPPTYILHAQTPLKSLTIKNQQAPMNLKALSPATEYSTTAM